MGNITDIDKASIADPTASSVSVGSYADYRDYTYDSLSQMTKSIERFANGTVTTDYAYDAYGNITSKVVTKNGTTTTIPYTYGTDSDAGWSKLLKSYNGQSIDYDAIGNPTTYLGATLGWSSGRQLTSYTKGSNNITYTYDADGLRASKTVNGVKTTYLYSNGLLVYQKQYKANHTDIDMHFWYNANGHLAAVEYFNNITGGWVLAYALTNSFGDVIGLYYGNGNLVTTYEYDAWGNLVYMNDTSALGIGTLNPIRYRSYYYDTDTGLYYCQSRYYDPQVGRFINADAYVSTGTGVLGNSMFTYCNNNPVTLSDSGGNRPIASMSVIEETADDRAASCAHMRATRQETTNISSHKLSVTDFINQDGTISLHDSRRHEGYDVPFYEQALWAGFQKPTLKTPEIIVKGGVLRGAGDYKYGRFDVSAGEAVAGLGFSENGVGVYGKATAFAIQVAGKIPTSKGVLTIGLSGDYGSIGAGAYADFTETGFRFKAGYSYGAGADIIIEWTEY